MKNRPLTLLSLLVALIFGASLFWSLPAQAADAPKEVRFAFLNGPRPWILGKVDGSFDKALGVPVKWVRFPSGPPALAALAAGEVDIVRVGSVPVTSSLTRGIPFKVIALSGVINTSEQLVARNSIKTIKDLEGHSVATVAGSTAHYALLAAFKVHGVDPKKVKLVNLNPTDQIAAWKRGDIDASYIWGPFWHDLAQEDGHILIGSGELNKDGYYLFNAYVVSDKFAQAYPDLVAKFLGAFQQTVDRYKADPDGSAAIIAKDLEQDVEGAKQTLAGLLYPSISDQLNPQWLGDGTTTANSNIAKSLGDQAAFLVEQNDLRARDVPKSFAPFIDVSYIKKAIGQ
ncbi:MAG: ABC transporter substrate-binding protein [Deltaproteobacteria bacterium]|jgi:taurine transport system substrate-binding protein|nr:ABC transporter substrate-binding protein [Deltaproteobacteria bacterium]